MKQIFKRVIIFAFAVVLTASSTSMSLTALEEYNVDKELISEGVKETKPILNEDEYVDTGQDSDVSEQSDYSSQEVTGLPDGIYAFENLDSGFFMTVSDSSTVAGSDVLQVQYDSSPATVYNAAALFKVTQVGTTGKYVIRLLLNNNLTLGINNSSYIVTKEIPENDSDVPEDELFVIEYGIGGYILKKNIGVCIGANGSSRSDLTIKSNRPSNKTINWIVRGYRTYIPNGVYAFENVGNAGMWMDTLYGGYDVDSSAQLRRYSSCPGDTFERSGLYKIEKADDDGNYNIRLMINNLLTWGRNTEGSIVSIAIDNSFNFTKYRIIYDDTDYIIVRDDWIISAESNSGNDYLCSVPRESMTDLGRWKMYKYTGSYMRGVGVVFPYDVINTGFVVGNNYKLKPVVWSTAPYMDTFWVEVEDESDLLADISMDNKNNAIININNPGSIFIKIIMYINSDGLVSIMDTEEYEYKSIPREGIYFIKNVFSDKYVNILGPSNDEGKVLHQWQFYNASQAKWQIEHVEGTHGYVRFKSLYNGLYMAVDPTNTNRIRQYSTKDDYSLWRFEYIDDRGSLKIICKACESNNTVLTTPADKSGNGEWLSQRVYSDDDNYSDEWYLNKYLSLSYVNYYDQTFNDAGVLNYISQANAFARDILLKHLNISVAMDGDAIQYDTIADKCPLGNDKSCDDSCNSYCNYHHKNLFAISNQIYNSKREKDHIYVLWSNRAYGTTCQYSNGKHTNIDPIGVVYNRRPVIQFVRFFPDNSLDIQCAALALVHETMHTLGMGDVYYNKDHEESETTCIMGQYYSQYAQSFYEVLNNPNYIVKPFCASCERKLRECINKIDTLYEEKKL